MSSERLMSKIDVTEALESLLGKSVLKTQDLNKGQIIALIQSTIDNKTTNNLFDSQPVKDKILIPLFDKPSLRTYAGTIAAWLRMGGNYIPLTPSKSREPIRHAARVMGGYADALVARVSSFEDLCEYDKHFLDRNKVKIPVISGMTDLDHILQFLADSTTALEKHPDRNLADLKIAYLGDYNNVARSTFIGYSTLGVNIRIASPTLSNVTEEDREYGNLHNEGNFLFTADPYEAVKDADIVMTDVWVSMGEENDDNSLKKLIHLPYQVNSGLMKSASPNAFVQHCMPVHPGEELTEVEYLRNEDEIIGQSHNRMFSTASLLAAVYKNK